MLISRAASQVVDFIPCQPTGLCEDDNIDSLRRSIFWFFVKSKKQGKCSCASCLTLSFLKKSRIGPRTPIPARSALIPPTVYHIFAAVKILQKPWYASSTQLKSGGGGS